MRASSIFPNNKVSRREIDSNYTQQAHTSGSRAVCVCVCLAATAVSCNLFFLFFLPNFDHTIFVARFLFVINDDALRCKRPWHGSPQTTG
jgi:hypothetical protein